MKALKFAISALVLLLFTSCIEIIDDISINEDGSGTFKYNINLSSSKIKLNSILALDSLDGRKVPSIENIMSRVNHVVNLLKNQEGISNLDFKANYNDFVFKIQCDFQSLELLQDAIGEVVKAESKLTKIPELDETWLTFEDDKLSRSIPKINVNNSSDLERKDIDLLKTGNYVSITRFYTEVEKYNNENCLLSKNKKAVMLRSNPYSLIENPNLLDNVIYLVKSN